MEEPNPPDRRVNEALELWTRSDTKARQDALRRLKRLGPRAAAAVPALIAGLADPNAKIRSETARVLGKIGPLAIRPYPRCSPR